MLTRQLSKLDKQRSGHPGHLVAHSNIVGLEVLTAVTSQPSVSYSGTKEMNLLNIGILQLSVRVSWNDAQDSLVLDPSKMRDMDFPMF